METNDPHLIKTPIEPTTDSAINHSEPVEANHVADASFNDDVLNDRILDDSVAAEDARIAEETSVNKGIETNKATETFDDNLVGTEHVNDGDMAARQPDRRDQEGDAFDDGINDKTTAHASPHNPKSDEITDLNRYASVDNAQTRVLNNTDQDK